jgi:hypothetical protein
MFLERWNQIGEMFRSKSFSLGLSAPSPSQKVCTDFCRGKKDAYNITSPPSQSPFYVIDCCHYFHPLSYPL